MGSPGAQGAKYPEHSNPAILLMGSANGGPVVKTDSQQPLVWPAWVYCTRYSDRPSSGEYPAPGGAANPADAGRTQPPGWGERACRIPRVLFSRLLSPFHRRVQPLPSVRPSFSAPGLCDYPWEVTAPGSGSGTLRFLTPSPSGLLCVLFLKYFFIILSKDPVSAFSFRERGF